MGHDTDYIHSKSTEELYHINANQKSDKSIWALDNKISKKKFIYFRSERTIDKDKRINLESRYDNP